MAHGLLILGPRCQNCDRPVPQSIASLLGDEFNGYLCLGCKAWKFEQNQRLLAEMKENRKSAHIPVDSVPMACAICGKFSRTMIRVTIDGRMGFVCANKNLQMPAPCERKWRERNREKLGPGAAYKLKLK